MSEKVYTQAEIIHELRRLHQDMCLSDGFGPDYVLDAANMLEAMTAKNAELAQNSAIKSAQIKDRDKIIAELREENSALILSLQQEQRAVEFLDEKLRPRSLRLEPPPRLERVYIIHERGWTGVIDSFSSLADVERIAKIRPDAVWFPLPAPEPSGDAK